MNAVINYFRKGPVCDDIADQYLLNLLNVGAVVCRNLGATLININTGATGPTNSMYIYIYIYFDNTWCKTISNSFYILRVFLLFYK